MLILIIIWLLALGVGGAYYGHRRWGFGWRRWLRDRHHLADSPCRQRAGRLPLRIWMAIEHLHEDSPNYARAFGNREPRSPARAGKGAITARFCEIPPALLPAPPRRNSA